MLSELDLTAWLTLFFTPQLGPKRLARLASIDSPSQILQRDQQALLAIGLTHKQIRFIRHQAVSLVEECLIWRAKAAHHHILTPFDKPYSPLLKQTEGYPPLLFIKGELPVLSQPQIAIVGSRHASDMSLNTARSFAADLALNGLVITSGLALGVDGHSHDGALSSAGKTVAVLGSGLESIYPHQHKALAKRIENQGALVSEFPPYSKPKASHFPRRNRIISGLSLGVLVVEAALRSGSLITARYALEQNRDVFAIPGSIHNPNARGCNELIKSGAALVQNVEDVTQEIETLKNWSTQQQATVFIDKDDNESLPYSSLLANVGAEVISVDVLARKSHIPVHEVMQQLLELELSGHIIAVAGGYIRSGRGQSL